VEPLLQNADPIVTRQTKDDNVYFTIVWSRLCKVDRIEIRKTVPAVPGLFELYYMDRRNTLNLLSIYRAWYGGLRSQIREKTDPTLELDPKRRHILESRPCYYRYTKTFSFNDMCDILYFFSETYFPHKRLTAASGRYNHIYVKERSKDKIVDL